MKYKVLKGTAAFAALAEIENRKTICIAAAKALADAQGAYAHAGGRGAGGGIRALCYAEKPDGFKLVQSPDFYFPKALKSNRTLLDQIAALPQVSDAEINNLVGFKSAFYIEGDGFELTKRPGIIFGEEHHLLDSGHGTIEHPDLIEIMESEYLFLQGK